LRYFGNGLCDLVPAYVNNPGEDGRDAKYTAAGQKCALNLTRSWTRQSPDGTSGRPKSGDFSYPDRTNLAAGGMATQAVGGSSGTETADFLTVSTAPRQLVGRWAQVRLGKKSGI
jgi:hypothetical protein